MPYIPSSMPMHQDRELPRFSLREVDLPEVREWEVNDSYYMIIKVKMVGKRDQYESDSPQDANKLEGDFEMLSIQALDDRPVDPKMLEQADFERVKARALSGGEYGQ